MCEKFFRGNFKGFLDDTINANPPRIELDEIPYIVGSFIFLGKLDHAQAILKKHYADLKIDRIIHCQFFIGIGLNRSGAYSESKAIFLDNIKLFRTHKLKSDDLTAFFVHQGLGFHYLFCSRYGLALRAAKASSASALQASFLFGRILAADLLGNAHAKVGGFTEAGKAFAEASELSQTLGNGGIADAVNINQTVVRSIAGQDHEDGSASLSTIFQSFVDSNNFSGISLGLELARQWTIKGNLIEAEKVLEYVQEQVVKAKNRRQTIILHLRWAHHYFLKGLYSITQEKLELAAKLINWEQDHSLALNYYGLKLKVLRAQGKEQSSQERDAARWHERQSCDGIHLRIVSRHEDTHHSTEPGDDTIGDLMDKVSKEGPTVDVIQSIIKTGFLALARDLFRTPPGARTIIINAIPGKHFVFDCGNVQLLETSLSPVCRQLLEFLAGGPRSTADIVKELWGLNYDPMKHNSTFYSAISRLRSFLGTYRSWLKGDTGIYTLDEGVKISFQNTITQEEPHNLLELSQTKHPVARRVRNINLNIRHLNMIKMLDVDHHLTNRIVQEKFGVSYATATRDLTILTKAGFIQKIGRGKATAYLSANNQQISL